jgi:serine/threonine protein kinase
MKPMLKAPGTKRLKLEYNKLLSSFAFNFNLRRYNVTDKLYVMMEFVPRNLLEILEDAGHGLERKHVRHCIFQLCKAITFIHGSGYVYRDIKVWSSYHARVTKCLW